MSVQSQGNEHPAPPGVQRCALWVCQHLSSKETRRHGQSAVGRQLGEERAKEQGCQECRSDAQASASLEMRGKGCKGSEGKGRENEKGVKELSQSLQRVPGSFSDEKRKKFRDD